MMVYLNGRFVPAEQASVSVFDRGFLYGDGLFESVRINAGRPFLWESHVHRLVQGAAALHIVLPIDPGSLHAAVIELLLVNQMSDAIVRISISRGPGPRGYSIRGADSPTVVITAMMTTTTRISMSVKPRERTRATGSPARSGPRPNLHRRAVRPRRA